MPSIFAAGCLTIVLCAMPVAHAKPHLQLVPMEEDKAFGRDWAGGCWFHDKGLKFMLHGEGKGSEALLNLDGRQQRIPFASFGAQYKNSGVLDRQTAHYRNKNLRVEVTTIVTEVSHGDECHGSCSESSAFAADVTIRRGKYTRNYRFNGACGL